jgi:hypothetical protein
VKTRAAFSVSLPAFSRGVPARPQHHGPAGRRAARASSQLPQWLEPSPSQWSRLGCFRMHENGRPTGREDQS